LLGRIDILSAGYKASITAVPCGSEPAREAIVDLNRNVG